VQEQEHEHAQRAREKSGRRPDPTIVRWSLGTLAPGKSADFLVLDQNPLENIANTTKIAAVYRRGLAIDR